MSGLTYEHLRKVQAQLGHAFFDNGDFNLNIIGVRTDDNRSNLFNDWIVLAFRQFDHPQLMVFAATTDPGTYWRQNPMNVKGTAIVVPGQYRSVWSIGKHRGKYEALVQRGPIKVYRDNNKDEVLDFTQEETGYFGINLHEASAESNEIGKWSAGCQVISRRADYSLLMAIVNRAAKEHGPKFSYTLLTERHLWG